MSSGGARDARVAGSSQPQPHPLSSRFSLGNVLDTLGLPHGIQLGVSFGRPPPSRAHSTEAPPEASQPPSRRTSAQESLLPLEHTPEPSTTGDPPDASPGGTAAADAARHRAADNFGPLDRAIAGWTIHQFVFLALLVLCTLLQHLSGLGWWIASTATLIQCNELVRAQVARKQGVQLLKLHAATFMLVMVGGGTLLLARERSMGFHFTRVMGALGKAAPPDQPTAGRCFQEALFLDVLARVVTTWSKVLTVSLHSCSTPAMVRRRAAVLTFIEHAALAVRHLLPASAWWAYYGAQPAPLLRGVAQATYMGIKVNIVYNRAKLAVAAFWNVGLAANAHGQPASPEDLMEAGAVCSICQEQMTEPLRLSCSHIFCDACISEWFERQNSCPMCRAQIRPPGMQAYGDGTTCILPYIF